MGFFLRIAIAVLFSAALVWYFNPGLFYFASADTDGYAARKAANEAPAAAGAWRRLTVEEAYRRVPHQRTPFRPDLAQMPPVEASYLAALFAVTDRGVVERVHLQGELYQSRPADWHDNNYEFLLAQLTSLPTPDKLLPVEALVFEAMQEQRNYFKDWEASGNPRYFTPRAGLVQSSHKKLIQAYQLLIDLYGGESWHNKQAFFDHLCALDFI